MIVIGDDTESAERIATTLRERGFEATAIEGGMDAWTGEDFTLQPSGDPEGSFQDPTAA